MPTWQGKGSQNDARTYLSGAPCSLISILSLWLRKNTSESSRKQRLKRLQEWTFSTSMLLRQGYFAQFSQNFHPNIPPFVPLTRLRWGAKAKALTLRIMMSALASTVKMSLQNFWGCRADTVVHRGVVRLWYQGAPVTMRPTAALPRSAPSKGAATECCGHWPQFLGQLSGWLHFVLFFHVVGTYTIYIYIHIVYWIQDEKAGFCKTWEWSWGGMFESCPERHVKIYYWAWILSDLIWKLMEGNVHLDCVYWWQSHTSYSSVDAVDWPQDLNEVQHQENLFCHMRAFL